MRLFRKDDRVTMTVYGVRLNGVVISNQNSRIVFVRTEDGRERWMHAESLTLKEG